MLGEDIKWDTTPAKECQKVLSGGRSFRQRLSTAFPGIKKLMRRAAYNFLRAGGQGSLTLEHVEPASGEMLFSGAA